MYPEGRTALFYTSNVKFICMNCLRVYLIPTRGLEPIHLDRRWIYKNFLGLLTTDAIKSKYGFPQGFYFKQGGLLLPNSCIRPLEWKEPLGFRTNRACVIITTWSDDLVQSFDNHFNNHNHFCLKQTLPLQIFKACPQQILLGPFLNTLSHMRRSFGDIHQVLLRS